MLSGLMDIIFLSVTEYVKLAELDYRELTVVEADGEGLTHDPPLPTVLVL